jgi:hypothetical protein
MATRKREGNRPDRRVAPVGFIDDEVLSKLCETLRYVGSAHHKLHPGDYGLIPPTNPRASKSACDDLRPLLLDEAIALMKAGIRLGMVSEFGVGGAPKYVWSVDADDEVYEAKSSSGHDAGYHGYRLGEDDPQRGHVLKEWKRRCRTS